MKEYRQTCLGPCGLLYQGSRKPNATAWHVPRTPLAWKAGKQCRSPIVVEVRKVGRWTRVEASS